MLNVMGAGGRVVTHFTFQYSIVTIDLFIACSTIHMFGAVFQGQTNAFVAGVLDTYIDALNEL